jgi:hypothetical protein
MSNQGTKIGHENKDLNIQDDGSGYQYQKEDESEILPNRASLSGHKDHFDMVNLQNEAFSRMFAEQNNIPSPSLEIEEDNDQ